MAEHQTEEQQVEAIKQWWKDNGLSVVAGLVIGFAALFGWNYWNDYRDEQAARASRIYQQLMTNLQASNAAAVEQQANTLRSDFKRTPYAALAALAQARLAVEAEDLDAAAAHLQWAVANSRQDQLEHTARLRLARMLIAADNSGAASAVLEKVKPGAYVAAYAEVEGDIAWAQGDHAAAREAYNRALVAAADDTQQSNVLKLKLDDIAAAPAMTTEEK
ncbi:MAG: tetratricopeptide repeat protein [Granulosicoccaceae bacterium]